MLYSDKEYEDHGTPKVKQCFTVKPFNLKFLFRLSIIWDVLTADSFYMRTYKDVLTADSFYIRTYKPVKKDGHVIRRYCQTEINATSYDCVEYHILCLLFGHKTDELYGDPAGLKICNRCDAHEYFDEEKWKKSGILLKPFYWLKGKYRDLKFEIQFWWDDKNNNLPF